MSQCTYPSPFSSRSLDGILNVEVRFLQIRALAAPSPARDRWHIEGLRDGRAG
jgi:hypothetical protein